MSQVPQIILKLYPKIKEKEYDLLKKDPGFRDKVAFVCQDCFLAITKHSEFNEGLLEKVKRSEKNAIKILGTRFTHPQLSTIVERV